VVFSFSPSSYFVFLILDGGWFVFYSRMLLILVYFFLVSYGILLSV